MSSAAGVRGHVRGRPGPHRVTGHALTRGRSPLLLAQVAVMLAAIGAWQIAYAAHVAAPGTLPSPSAVASELTTLVTTSAYWRSVLDTFESWGLGLLIASAMAIPTGIFIGANGWAYRATRATIDFVRTLPPVALIPVVALLYGATATTALVLVVFATLWPLLLQAMYGIRQVDPVARDTAAAFRLGRWRTAWSVWLPSALPFIGTGLRIASTMSLLLAVGVELIAGSPGVGARIADAQAAYQTTPMYAYIFTAACLGVILTAALAGVERRLLRWHPSYRAGER